MLEGARRVALAVAIGGSTLASFEPSAALAGGCYRDSELPYCNPVVLQIDRPRFHIQALDFKHDGQAEVWVGSKTRRFILFGDVTPDGANEGKAKVEESCGPNGDNSLRIEPRPDIPTMVTSLACIERIEQTS